jgi:hypothetical protein
MRDAAVAEIVMNLRPFVSIREGYRLLSEEGRLGGLLPGDAEGAAIA